jgi:hypothetical protein
VVTIVISSEAAVVGADGRICVWVLEDIIEDADGIEITILDEEELLVEGSWEVSTSAASLWELSFVKLSVMESDTFSSISNFSADNVGDSVVLT